MTPEGIGARTLRYWEIRQAATANNLANASTPGFKAERVFARLLDDASIRISSGTDFSDGSIKPTGRPLDIALVGDGFLVVETPGGSRWLRGGSLTLDADGHLLDGAGRPVLGARGHIVLPPGKIEITTIGEVLVDGIEHARLRVERPRGGSVSLEREGANLWVPPARVELLGEGQVHIRQGHLEESNVDPVGSLVEMIKIQRAYTAIQRTLITEDSIMQTITNEIGRVG